MLLLTKLCCHQPAPLQECHGSGCMGYCVQGTTLDRLRSRSASNAEVALFHTLLAIQPMHVQAWAGTSRKARDALRRGSLEVVHALETRILREVGTCRSVRSDCFRSTPGC